MKDILDRTRGQALVEYALILVLVAIVVIGVLSIFGSAVSNVFGQVTDALTSDSGAGGGAGGEKDCYGSLLLPYLVGLTGLLSLGFRLLPERSDVVMQV